jgi:hypothetical protein
MHDYGASRRAVRTGKDDFDKIEVRISYKEFEARTPRRGGHAAVADAIVDCR